MRVWPALVVAPFLALLSIGLSYALAPPACAHGGAWLVHAAILGPLVLSVGATLLALSDIRRRREPFLPLVAAWSGAFFSFVIAGQWLTTLFVSPCRI